MCTTLLPSTRRHSPVAHHRTAWGSKEKRLQCGKGLWLIPLFYFSFVDDILVFNIFIIFKIKL
jgi:hypothetical protein